MARYAWEQLPHDVREGIESHCGPVLSTVNPPIGHHSDLSVIVHAGGGLSVFCKGARLLDERKARMREHEARVTPHLPLLAPRLLWQVRTGEWLVHGYEHVGGRCADLSPGSRDLPHVAHTVAVLAASLTPCPAGLPSVAEQWARWAPWRRVAAEPPDDLDDWDRAHLEMLIEWEERAVGLVDGDALVHRDLQEMTMLVGRSVRVIDWSWSSRAEPWFDVIVLVTRLIAAGHTPREAERWATTVGVLADASEEAVTACAVALLGMWAYARQEHPEALDASLVSAAREWVQHRLPNPGGS
jgi:hypothetical protein